MKGSLMESGELVNFRPTKLTGFASVYMIKMHPIYILAYIAYRDFTQIPEFYKP